MYIFKDEFTVCSIYTRDSRSFKIIINSLSLPILSRMASYEYDLLKLYKYLLGTYDLILKFSYLKLISVAVINCF